MQQITTDWLREKWKAFWKEKGHAIIPSASVLPENDPTALFHNSGMHPLVPYLSGEPHPAGTRLANSQKCIRTIDIDEVGDATHLTFFEMLGNWSLGDFFKHEQIGWSFEFLTDELNLPLEKLAFSVFAGDENAPRDSEAAARWKELGVPENRIAYLPISENWWAKGDTGLCGPDTEMFYWTGESPAPASFQDTHEDERWVEIWNDVFMQFDRKEDGTLVDLPSKNIDTGMGLERTVAVLNGKKSVYETDAFVDILAVIAAMANDTSLAKNPNQQTEKGNSARIIADHIRTAVVLIADRVLPSNTDQGYILRRLLRRAIRHGRKLGINQDFTVDIAAAAIAKLSSAFPEIKSKSEGIKTALQTEEQQFSSTLSKGEKEFLKLLAATSNITGEGAFYLYETYGFPIEMTEELAVEKGITVDRSGFETAMKAHQAKSREGAAQKFAGGLADDSTETTNLHTATHLMHAGLRKVLGDHVSQRGSNITPERLRFDFGHPEKVMPEQIAAVEEYVNAAIAADVEISWSEMQTDEAFASGALGFFGHKYGDRVKVYAMGEWSREICGGPHAERTGELGTFKIKKEQSASKGVRRIKAILS